jgi:hypothetical protein
MLTLLHNVLDAPTDAGPRRINPGNESLRRRLASLPVPPTCYVTAAATATPSTTGHAPAPAPRIVTWPGLLMLTAVGWVPDRDGRLQLPLSAERSLLATRALELRSVLPLLQASEEVENVVLASVAPAQQRDAGGSDRDTRRTAPSHVIDPR